MGDYMQLEAAVDRGLITEHRIDTSLCRLLEARFALGEMDDDSLVPWSRIGIDTVDCQTHKQMALDIARKSLVLLHNDGVLPLDKTRGDVVVMGPNAVDSVMQWETTKVRLRIPIRSWTVFVKGLAVTCDMKKGATF